MTRIASYTDAGATLFEDVSTARQASGVTWVDVTGSPEELGRVMEAFDIHALSVEDIDANLRPKVEEFPDYTFLLCQTASMEADVTGISDELATEQVGIFLGNEWLVTASETTIDAVDVVWQAMIGGRAKLLGAGADFAAYRVLDQIVDEYYLLAEELEESLDAVEERVLDPAEEGVLTDLNALRRDLLAMRKLLWPTREMAGILARGDPDQVSDGTEKYFRDVHDHLLQLVDLTETYRDLARGSRETYLNTLSQSTNELMKRLTVVATIILPLTLVAGVFGMNFAGSPYAMPELRWRYGYPAVMLGMAIVGTVMLVHFRREGWL
jgi:magnesium transporter